MFVWLVNTHLFSLFLPSVRLKLAKFLLFCVGSNLQSAQNAKTMKNWIVVWTLKWHLGTEHINSHFVCLADARIYHEINHEVLCWVKWRQRRYGYWTRFSPRLSCWDENLLENLLPKFNNTPKINDIVEFHLLLYILCSWLGIKEMVLMI